MFGFRKSKDIIQLFSKAGQPDSLKVANLLKQISAASANISAADQPAGQAPIRDEFELQITEDAPTADQLETIFDYVGAPGIPQVIQGASNRKDAVALFKKNANAFKRPLIVDWNNGKAYAGAEESVILKMLNALPPKN